MSCSLRVVGTCKNYDGEYINFLINSILPIGFNIPASEEIIPLLRFVNAMCDDAEREMVHSKRYEEERGDRKLPTVLNII